MRFFKKMFARDSLAAPVASGGPDVPPEPDKLTYLVGDVHGRRDLLETLLTCIASDAGAQGHRIVCLGDYIDRGEQSADVLQILFERSQQSPDDFVCLMGNHEKMLLDFLAEPAGRGPRWLHNGGLQTLASYKIGGVLQSASPDTLSDAAQRLETAMGADILGWLRGLPLSWSSGTLWAVHAGAVPDLPMDQQPDRVLLWGDGAFLQQGRRDGLWVAHGHTVFDLPQVQGGRIAVDTGAYFSGRLTAAVVTPGTLPRFLQT